MAGDRGAQTAASVVASAGGINRIERKSGTTGATGRGNAARLVNLAGWQNSRTDNPVRGDNTAGIAPMRLRRRDHEIHERDDSKRSAPCRFRLFRVFRGFKWF